MTDRRFKCVAVRSPRGARVTEIEWGDGHKGKYPHDVLRGYCPCAGCQGHGPVIAFVPSSIDTQREIDAIEPVGNYALGIKWFDGHDTGIYSYRYLRALCQCDTCAVAAGAPQRPDLPRM